MAAALLGVAIGAALGLLGGGGAILAVPALVYGVGQPVSRAVTTSLFVVGISSGAGAWPRVRARQVRWPVAGVFGAAGAGTAFAGTAANSALSPRALLLAFAALMVAVAVRMLYGDVRPRGACAAPDGAVNWRGCLPKALAAGAVVGFLTGLFGVGGGFVIVPALALLLGLDMATAIGTSLVIIVLNSVAGFLAHAQSATVDWPIALVFAGGALFAAFVTGRLGARMDAEQLRRWFAWLIVGVAMFVATEAALNAAALSG